MVIDKTPRHDTTLLIGDLNAKIGSKLEGEDGIVGRHGVQSKRNDEEKLVSFCGTIKQPCHNNNYVPSQRNPFTHTWTSPNSMHKNQIVHVAIKGKFKKLIKDIRFKLHKVQWKSVRSSAYKLLLFLSSSQES